MFIISVALFLTLRLCVPAVESQVVSVVDVRMSSNSCNEQHVSPTTGILVCGAPTGSPSNPTARQQPPASLQNPKSTPPASRDVVDRQKQIKGGEAADSSPTGGVVSDQVTSKNEVTSPKVGEQQRDNEPHTNQEDAESFRDPPQEIHDATGSVTSDHQRVQAKKEKIGDEGETKTRRENRQGNEGEQQNSFPPPQVTGQDGRYVESPLRGVVLKNKVSRPSDAMASDTNETSSSEESEQRRNGLDHKRHAMMLSAVLSFIIF